MNECFEEAIHMSDKVIDDGDRLLIDGKDTVGFLSRRFPQSTIDGIPIRSASLLRTIPGPGSNYAPRAISDRYVICMMKRGYKWEEGPPKW
ncbi:MAG: hypothetical protein FIB02_08620 [Desulfuromonas sp.]|nr:hypothetical protein [Desulfuromonas sp.]